MIGRPVLIKVPSSLRLLLISQLRDDRNRFLNELRVSDRCGVKLLLSNSKTS